MGELLTGQPGPISSSEIVEWGVLFKDEDEQLKEPPGGR